MQRSVRKASPASRRAAMRRRRHLRIRRKVAGTTERPRLAVYRSLKHVVAQIIDDSRGVTLVGVSSSEPALAAVIPPATSPGATPTPPAAPEAAGAQAAAEAGAGPEKQGASEAGARSEKKTAGGGARDAGAKAKGDKKKTAAGGKDEEPKPSKKDRPTAARPEGAKTARARAAGRTLAERALAKGIRRVVFDRGGYVFHGRVRAFAEGARAGGLEF